jgi:subfamily B ATP-binding cassette protein MsbA
MSSTSAIARRLLTYFRPHRGTLALALVLITLHSAIPGLLVFLIQRVLDDVLINQDHALLAVLPFGLMALYATNGALAFGRGMLTRSVSWRVVTDLRRELFVAMLHQDVAWHQTQPTGAQLARLTQDVNNVQYGVSGIVTAVQKPLTLIILLGAAFTMNAKLALISLIVLPFIALPISRFGRRLRLRSRESLDNLAGLAASTTESLMGIRVIKAHGGEADRTARFDAENETQYRLQMQAFAAQLMPGPIIELMAAVSFGAVLWIGGQQVFSGEVQPGELIAFMVALGLLNEPMKGLGEMHSLTVRAVTGAERIFEILDRVPAVPDTGTEILDTHTADVRIEAVGFDYGDGLVLDGLDLHIAPGRMVALVGASGSGKSTAASLLSRFYDPTGGRITLNGTDLRAFTLASLRHHVALVSQHPFLFNDTVAANIAFGTEGATPADIEAAARTANAHDFILALPQGYGTPIDELGQRLSGGQRQRICIARAVLRDAPILVLDEATSALDAESEAVVQEALDRLMADRTVLAIAHRLSTIRGADEILVLDHGRIVERGSHADLMAAPGTYAQLVRRQG